MQKWTHVFGLGSPSRNQSTSSDLRKERHNEFKLNPGEAIWGNRKCMNGARSVVLNWQILFKEAAPGSLRLELLISVQSHASVRIYIAQRSLPSALFYLSNPHHPPHPSRKSQWPLPTDRTSLRPSSPCLRARRSRRNVSGTSLGRLAPFSLGNWGARD